MRISIVFLYFFSITQLYAESKVIIKNPCIWNDAQKNKKLWQEIVNKLEINPYSWYIETTESLESFQNSSSCISNNEGFDSFQYIFSIKLLQKEKLVIILNQPGQNERVFIDNKNINVNDQNSNIVTERIFEMINNIAQVIKCKFDQNNGCIFYMLDTTSLSERIKTYLHSGDCKKLEEMYNYFKETQSIFTQKIGKLLFECQKIIEDKIIEKRKIEDYQKGMDLMKEQNFKSALIIFRSLKVEYEQSFDQITKCKLELFGIDSIVTNKELLFWWNSLPDEWKVFFEKQYYKYHDGKKPFDNLNLIKWIVKQPVFSSNEKKGINNFDGFKYLNRLHIINLCWTNKLKDYESFNRLIQRKSISWELSMELYEELQSKIPEGEYKNKKFLSSQNCN